MASLSPTSVEAPAPLRVYDVADPHRHGTIIKAGPEVSEVRFDDGPERNIANAHLRPVGTSVDEDLTRSTLPEEAVLHRGREAWNRLRTNSTWEDWKAVGKAHVIGEATAMRGAHVNKPKGRCYNAAFSAWARKFGFEGLDKGVRSRLLDVMKHLAEIDVWLAKLPATEQQKINHPNTVWRKWKASTVVPDPNAPAKVSPSQKLSESVATLPQGGGDLWSPQDKPQDIAKVIVGKLTKSKAEKVAREILKMLSGASRDA